LRSDELAASGSRIWEAGTADAIRVRGSVKDRAGNVRQAELMIADGLAQVPSRVDGGEAPRPISPISRSNQAQDDDPFESVSPGRAEEDPFAEPAPARDQSEPPDRASEPPPSAPTLLVGSPQCALKYAVEDSGGSGPALVELWVTRDGGRTWSRQPPDEDRTSPYQLDLGGEGTYGLWLVVQGASGLGDAPPGPGDRPQMWVEVDSTAPSLQLDPPQVGTGRSIGMVLITWKANDAHLAEKPVQLSYRPDTPDADWQPLTERIANTGRYVWKVPPGTPPRFHLRVEALDTLGNRASAETTDFGPPVIVDRSRPRGRILGLDTNSQSRLGVDDRTRQ
jgi:hypothetical protein